jgi:aubergine-like protein
VNAKLGFPLWVVEPVEKISKKTMVIGVDVYHKTIKGKNSCAGFVASLDAEFSKYYSSTVI